MIALAILFVVGNAAWIAAARGMGAPQ